MIGVLVHVCVEEIASLSQVTLMGCYDLYGKVRLTSYEHWFWSIPQTLCPKWSLRFQFR
jgi:hypothetical protein